MIYFPPCKINLGLHILSRRDDGYHEIESGMLEIPFRDLLEIIPSEESAFTSSGLEIPGTGNSCIAAYELLRKDFGLPNVRMHLHKIVPMGGGLGGGSSDSAWTLKALNEQFALGLSAAQLEYYAAQLGSDNPFFIKGGLQLATGRGEVLEPLDIPLPVPVRRGVWQICLVNLGIHVPTKDAYRHVTPQADRRPLKEILQLPIGEWKNGLVNDFEASVFLQHPQLKTIKEDLYRAGAVYAAMSGSGSTLFGLFEEKPSVVQWTYDPLFETWV
jgi:4-diphosphocytidyl-2-C-methyl-D-erythritol kinase